MSNSGTDESDPLDDTLVELGKKLLEAIDQSNSVAKNARHVSSSPAKEHLKLVIEAVDRFGSAVKASRHHLRPLRSEVESAREVDIQPTQTIPVAEGEFMPGDHRIGFGPQ